MLQREDSHKVKGKISMAFAYSYSSIPAKCQNTGLLTRDRETNATFGNLMGQERQKLEFESALNSL